MLQDYLQEAPHSPGIYIYKDSKGAALYVGKAKDLKKRISSYFTKDVHVKTSAMLKQAQSIEFIVVENEIEALILECNLIKRLLPRYNTRMTDGKTYPYVKITNEEFPRISVTRQVIDDGAEYIGPFIHSFALRHTLKNLQTEFNFRTCFNMDNRSRPCILYHIKRCQAPCVMEVDRARYMENIERIRRILTGSTDIIKDIWTERMNSASLEQEYEKAAVFRDKIRFLEETMDSTQQNIQQPDRSDEDYFAIESKDGMYCIYVLHIVEGNVIGRDIDYLYYDQADKEEILFEYIRQFYDKSRAVPKSIFITEGIDHERIKREILKKRGIAARVLAPSDHSKQQLMAMTQKNAAFRLGERRIKDEQKAILNGGVDGLRKLLELDDLERIECIDISHFQGAHTYGAVVVYENGMFNKSEYRLFKIKSFEGIDDPRAVREVVRRQYTRLARHGKFPDLIIIDGGIPQLNAAKEELMRIRTSGFRLVSLAKREERLYIAPMNESMTFEKKDPRRLMLEKIRDEAHRFVIQSHRRGRSRKTIEE